uniref:Uncharacterized protein n=1 Tax=Trieres chinensis TaxID=1514140 RepID=A0A7S2A5G3_TRICV|mmetsp:Transcript_39623/g.80853  ORF Transcript_39623/g.80853 Transcript_39623/m.80853 type:complete len:158 (+) Transcript_39623:204-677(+)|eukprot:CAMPEP_0183315106 /NCGR_PEP_ID=MMETSP0160_2-20130417/50680_1 /TAXON_ID=2839 ORGANISM="Odontella Sinensis, Strain Grunow 1884" /NCGR_SAMPLE_ID=MMETSP0160_2 /ASSEMBLY_ACC=CAM_ASM_000250 /LENGTH=157 /DNA_ID=CAMNT_0025480595 /DNA_START=261 /DNA_END=734 /DNA_ORIENTATION=-
MRPAPLDQTYEHVNEAGVKVVSTRGSSDAYDCQGVTRVYGARGALLYEMDELFVGRQKVSVSPDGKLLVIDGSIYFGDTFLRAQDIDPDEVLTRVYLNGTLHKEVRYTSDLSGPSLSNLPALGGGWIRRNCPLSVCWEQNVLKYTFPENDVKEVPLR